MAALLAGLTGRDQPPAASSTPAPMASPALVSCSGVSRSPQHQSGQQHHHDRVERHDDRADPEVAEPGGQQEAGVRRGVGHAR